MSFSFIFKFCFFELDLFNKNPEMPVQTRINNFPCYRNTRFAKFPFNRDFTEIKESHSYLCR